MQELGKCIDLFFEKGLGDPFKKNHHLATKLTSAGTMAVEAIFEKLKQLKAHDRLLKQEEEDGFPVASLVSVLRAVADLSHINIIETILFWDEVIKDNDRTIRWALLKTLKKIGDPMIIPIVMKYKKIIKDKKYQDFIRNGEVYMPGKICNERDLLEADEVINELEKNNSNSLRR